MSLSQRTPESEIEAWLRAFLREDAFLYAYPYYAAILAKLIPVVDPSVQRMAVSLHDGRFYLHVNVDSFLREPHFVRGVLLHEVHHVVLGHLTHPKFAEAEAPELMDLAIEMSANEYIDEPLPPAITWRAYSAYGLRAHQSTRERYELLLGHQKAQGARPVRGASEHAAEVIDDHRFLHSNKAIAGGVAQTALMLGRAIAEAHEHAPRSPEPSDAKAKPLDDLARRLDEANRSKVGEGESRYLVCGCMFVRLLEELEDTTRAPEAFLDWRTALHMFVARARAPVHTWSRPSRRFPERVFEVPGRSWAPRRSENPTLMVAIDTSLSMTRRELEEIARQLVVLSERATLLVAECDVEVSRIAPFSGRIDAVMGRGGTDLRPVFAPELLGAHDVDGVVYFTDGDGPFPAERPSVPTLWVLTKPRGFACPWGERAALDGILR